MAKYILGPQKYTLAKKMLAEPRPFEQIGNSEKNFS